MIGRQELFSESFLDPVAAAIEQGKRSTWARLVRLWLVVLVLNLVGGTVLALVVSPDGALPTGSRHALVALAEEIAATPPLASFSTAVTAGALLTLMSYMLHAVDSSGSRIAIAYLVGFLLALGPFNHVGVTSLHLLFGVLFGGQVTYADILAAIGISIPGNMLGGLSLMASPMWRIDRPAVPPVDPPAGPACYRAPDSAPSNATAIMRSVASSRAASGR